MPAFELFLEGGAQAFHTDVFLGADLDGVRVVLQKFSAARFVGDFDLVEHAQARRVFIDDAFERLVRDFEMVAVIGRRTVHDFQDAVGMGGHAERALERFDQVVGELANESDGIAQDDVFAIEVKLSRGAVECGEELVFNVDVGACQAVRERGLACVRVTDNADLENVRSLVCLLLTCIFNLLKLFLEFLDALTNHTAVCFELRLARPLGADAAIVLAAKVRPRTGETRHHVLQLRDFDHQAAFSGDGMFRENVQNKPRAVENLDSRHAFFEVTDLRTGEVIVKDNHLGVVFFESALDLVHLALSNERRWAKILDSLQKTACDECPCGLGESPQFGELFASKPRANLGRCDTH